MSYFESMNEFLPAKFMESPKPVLGAERKLFADDEDDNRLEQLNTDKDSFPENDENVYIEPRVDGDEWILAHEAFFERFPFIEVPTERVLVDRLTDGQLTVDVFRKNFIDAKIEYETLAALLRGAPKGEIALNLPNLEEYATWSQDEKNQHQNALEFGLIKNQYSTWLRQISGRFSALAEFLQVYKNVAEAEGITLEEGDEDNLKKVA